MANHKRPTGKPMRRSMDYDDYMTPTRDEVRKARKKDKDNVVQFRPHTVHANKLS